MVVKYKHVVGDGYHFINSNVTCSPDGTVPLGDTSECAILTALHVLGYHHPLPPMPELWNTAYPEDPMDEATWRKVLFVGLQTLEHFEAKSIDDLTLVLEDLRAIACERLADTAVSILRTNGVAL